MSETTSLAVVQNMNAALVFVPGGAEPLLSRLEKEAREQAALLDIATPAGRSAIASLAFKIARSKTALDKAGKDLKAEWKAKSDAVDAERRIIWDRVEALQTEIRAPLTAYEDAEKAAIAAHEAALAEIVAPPEYGQTETAAEIGQRIVRLRAGSNRDWGLFAPRAQAATAAEIARMEGLHAAAVKREADAAELVRLRAEAAERQRLAEIEAQREREKAIARRAEEEATRRAQEEADRQAKEAAAAAEAALQAAREETARKEREAAEALEAERRRAEREAEETRRAAQRAEYHRSMLGHVKACGLGFIDNKPYPIGILLHELQAKITFDEENFGDLLPEAIAARDEALARLQASADRARQRAEAEQRAQEERERLERQAHEAQAAAERAEAARLRDEAAVKMAEARAAQVERDRQAAVAQAKKDAAELAAKVESDRIAAAEQAEINRQIAERKAEQRRVEAINNERLRIEAERAEEDRKAAARAANVEHKRKINLAAQVALAHVLVEEGVGHDLAATLGKAIVIALATGKVPAAKIEY